MVFSVASPRLLPLTIVAMVALLSVKSVGLVRAAMPADPAAGSTGPATSAAPDPVPSSPAAKAAKSPAPKSEDHAAVATESLAATQVVPTVPAAAPPQASQPPISDSERSLLLDLRQRRSELDAREAALATRQSVLAGTEKRLADRVTELTALQTRLETLERARAERDQASWRGLVKTYETMKPRDAAAIFNDLEMPVLLQVFDRMKEAKVAAVMAAMAPERARLVTSELAQMRLRDNAAPSQPAAARTEPLVAKPGAVPGAGP